jgi:hypothetical protein
MPANPISVSLCAKENEWVAPQFHRKVHVNNRIYIEGAGIEKLGYERLTEYFSQWGAVYNVELKVNNRDGRRQKKVYGFVTFQEEGAAAACIESAKAGIEIEPGRPLSVRSAFFMPRRNSFDTEKSGGSGNHQNWSATSSQPGGLPTIHDSRSPSPNNNSGFTTGEWKNEMAIQNGHSNKMVTVEDQARKLFEIFQSLPANAKDRILQILNAQQYQEEQLKAIREIQFDDKQNGSGSPGESITSMMQHVSVNDKPTDRSRIYQTSSISSMNGHAITHTTGSRDAFSDALPSSGANYAKTMNSNPQQLPLMPRYQDINYPAANNNQSRNNGISNNNFYVGQSGSLSRTNRDQNFHRQWSEPIVGTNNNYEFPNQFEPTKSAARSIPQKNRNDNALSLDLPESFGPSSPGVWEMPNSPPKNYGSKFNDYSGRTTRTDEFNY